jgi:hypothetical protein
MPITPRAFSSGESVASLARTPRILNEPVRLEVDAAADALAELPRAEHRRPVEARADRLACCEDVVEADQGRSSGHGPGIVPRRESGARVLSYGGAMGNHRLIVLALVVLAVVPFLAACGGGGGGGGGGY